MSAIDTYTKYNLHSAAPYIGGGNLRVCKKQGGNVRGNFREGSVRGGEMFYTRNCCVQKSVLHHECEFFRVFEVCL